MVSTLDSQSSGPGPGAPLTYFNDGGGGIFLGLIFWPKGIFFGL